MAIRFPEQFNALSLPAIDQAAQQKEYNALRNDALEQGAERKQTEWDDARKQQAQQRLYQMATKSKQILESGQGDWAQLLPEWMQGLQEMGLPTDKIPPAGSAPESVMEGLNNILQSADLQGGNPQQPITANDLVKVSGEDGPVYSTAQDALGQGVPQSSISTAKPPASISEYNLYREQMQAQGQEPMSFLDFRKEINEQQAAGRESGKLTTQLELRPEVESAVTRAVQAAKQAADVDKENRSNQRALQIYDVAVQNLAESMGDTWTGPAAGLMPAVTSNQQIADGAVAAIAPVLKQLFRAAGEGIFTDKDQELLLAMVPTRTDRPDARAAKLLNIDAIVRAKLTPLERSSDNSIKYDAQGNRVQ